MSSNEVTDRTFPAFSLAMLVLAVLLGCVLPVANAWAVDGSYKETVNFRDLNANTRAGAAALYGRIHAAAKRVCHEFDPLLSKGVSACVINAETHAIEEANLPALTNYYRTQMRYDAGRITANR